MLASSFIQGERELLYRRARRTCWLVSDDRVGADKGGQDGDDADEKGDERDIAFEGERHDFFLSGCGYFDAFIV